MYGHSHSSISKEKISEHKKNPSEKARYNMRKGHADFNGINNPNFSKKKSTDSSKYYGVSIKRNGKYSYWVVQIRGKHISQHKSELEAALAYDKYIIENNINHPINFPE